MIIQLLVFYCCLLFVWLLSTLLVLNEGWKRNGFIQTYEQSIETTKDLLRKRHWTIQVASFAFAVAFFYYCIPVTLYERFYKHNVHANLFDPRGKYPL